MDDGAPTWYLTSRGHVVATPEGPTTRTALRRRGAWSPTHRLIVEAHTGAREVVAGVMASLPAHLAVSHLTAARMHGIPLPDPWSRQEPVHVSAVPPRHPPRRRGVVGHTDARLEVVTITGIRCASLASTWRHLAGLLSGTDLVAAADSILSRECPVDGLITPELLIASVPPGARGSGAARQAIVLADGRAASPPETTLRLLVASWGLPRPVVNADLYDGAGQWLGTGDLVWEEQRVVAEYEGGHHRTDRRHWQHDIERTRLLEAAGWSVVRVTARDLRRPHRVREALEEALGRRRPAR